MFERADTGDGLDAADACGDGLLADDFQHADVADAMDVRAAAKFLGIEAARGAFVGNGDDADVALGIFVAEKGERAGSERVVDGRDGCRRPRCCGESRRSPAARCRAVLRHRRAAKCEKSKRMRSGAISEPACFTCVPRMLRSAACTRWVAAMITHDARRGDQHPRRRKCDRRRAASLSPSPDARQARTG